QGTPISADTMNPIVDTVNEHTEDNTIHITAEEREKWNGYALPNLLLNPDFGVNQRGKTSYSANSTVYTYDRWLTAYATVTREANTSPAPVPYMAKCVFQNLNWPNFGQTLEHYSQYVGKALTVRFWIKGLPGTSSVTLFMGDSLYNIPLTGDWQEVTRTFDPVTEGTVSFSRKGLLLQSSVVSPVAGTGFYLAAPQLVYGSFAGVYIPPNPAEELLKCQRYYYVSSNNRIYGYTNATNEISKTVYPTVALPAAMRTVPTVTMPTNGVTIRAAGKDVHLVSIEGVYLSDRELSLDATADAAIGNRQTISGWFDTTNPTTFDAEIYQ
ncbi:MAG: hypothetical protein ACOX6U_04885, partial [Oscillospiraceae bacterium]